MINLNVGLTYFLKLYQGPCLPGANVSLWGSWDLHGQEHSCWDYLCWLPWRSVWTCQSGLLWGINIKFSLKSILKGLYHKLTYFVGRRVLWNYCWCRGLWHQFPDATMSIAITILAAELPLHSSDLCCDLSSAGLCYWFIVLINLESDYFFTNISVLRVKGCWIPLWCHSNVSEGTSF